MFTSNIYSYFQISIFYLMLYMYSTHERCVRFSMMCFTELIASTIVVPLGMYNCIHLTTVR